MRNQGLPGLTPLDLQAFLSKIRPVTSGGTPEEVFKFVDQYVDSVEQLEILLLLFENDRDWTVAEIFQRIQSSPGSIAQRLQSLIAARLLSEVVPGRFRFAPQDHSIRGALVALAAAYRERPVRIIEAIYSRKTDAVKSFAEAFRFKQKE